MKKDFFLKQAFIFSVLAGSTTLFPSNARASTMAGGGMPWDYTLNAAIMELTGPIAQGIAIVTIVVMFLMMTMSEHGAGLKSFFRIGLGISGALEAGIIITRFFMGGSLV
jgi:type IV secretory pathway VirB2 component (pilin)